MRPHARHFDVKIEGVRKQWMASRVSRINIAHES